MSDRSFGTVTHELVLGAILRNLGRRMLPDQDRAVGLLLAIKLARLRQPHRAQVFRRVPGRHLAARNDVDQRPDALAVALLAGPAHGLARPFNRHAPRKRGTQYTPVSRFSSVGGYWVARLRGR